MARSSADPGFCSTSSFSWKKPSEWMPVLRTLDLEGVEGVAFLQTEFAADDLVLRQRIAVDVDALDIDARRIGDT